ncbi:hypothetical protein [Williamsia sp. CHRR-6]|uniref:Rv1733c family protein n=1 Tax=Williamsia sp. CHRR-6 TaxID=2835871 RepID=UPI001BDA9CD9|nr:hypothetical protein [Williamsia sp. CHRR-6]MBT0567182.1 hypothetical protein [Williamsia sp. CHRR-6]
MVTTIAREMHLWRLLHAGRNPLVRGIDRLESLVVLAMVALALVVSPMVFVVGGWVHENATVVSDRQHAQRHQTEATLLDNPARSSDTVSATWRSADGTVHTAPIVAELGDRRGVHRTIWIDADGGATQPPLSHSAALVQAGLAGLSVAVVLITATVLVLRLIRITFDRRRYRDWAIQWATADLDAAT